MGGNDNDIVSLSQVLGGDTGGDGGGGGMTSWYHIYISNTATPPL